MLKFTDESFMSCPVCVCKGPRVLKSTHDAVDLSPDAIDNNEQNYFEQPHL